MCNANQPKPPKLLLLRQRRTVRAEATTGNAFSAGGPWNRKCSQPAAPTALAKGREPRRTIAAQWLPRGHFRYPRSSEKHGLQPMRQSRISEQKRPAGAPHRRLIHRQLVEFGPADDGCHVSIEIIRDAFPPVYTVNTGVLVRHAHPYRFFVLWRDEQCEEVLVPANTNSRQFTPIENHITSVVR